MNTAKYDPQTRKSLKSFQRTSIYQMMKEAHLAERKRLEGALREEKNTVARLSKQLRALGVDVDQLG